MRLITYAATMIIGIGLILPSFFLPTKKVLQMHVGPSFAIEGPVSILTLAIIGLIIAFFALKGIYEELSVFRKRKRN